MNYIDLIKYILDEIGNIVNFFVLFREYINILFISVILYVLFCKYF